ncbi:coiled-coil domain-containing protein 170 [Ambystoma mexicanum]|uniref:coiled-coil domain-containing protein 170 n=1 Tax=Ambystoma mexicanum TaxID=8296 RepID=UPI0037E96D31
MSESSSVGGGAAGSNGTRAEPPAGARIIDANCNSAFRAYSPSTSLWRSYTEMPEHFNLIRRQMGDNEDFGAGRGTVRNRSRHEAQKDHLLDIPVTREQMNHYRLLAENSRSELAALLVKYESSQSELLDLRSRLSSREVTLQELRGEVESYKENNARQSSLINSLRGRVQETEEETGLLVNSKNRAELTVQAVLQENQELKEKIREQDERLKKYYAEWEESKHHASRNSRNSEEFVAHLSGCLEVDIRGRENPQELLLSKVSEQHKENAVLKGRIFTLEETINVHETESKASRETIMRLVSEINREQKKASSSTQETDTLRKELDFAKEAKQQLERDVRTLRERLAASQRAWEACKQELSHVKMSSSELGGSLKSIQGEAKAAQGLLNAFKERMAALLSSSSITVKPSEEAIMERIRDVCNKGESKKIVISQLESRVSKLNEQLQNQTDLHQEALQRARKAEEQLEDTRCRIGRMESDLVSGDVMRDSLSLEKQRYLKFLEQLSDKMKLTSVAADVGFDMRLEVCLARAEQLAKLEGEAIIESKTLSHNLQRKLKTQKEKLESKELHMDLLRKKIAQLDEEKQVRTALAVERDDANLTVRKLQKKVDRLQKELSASQLSNTELKAKLADTNELKIRTLEQHKAIEGLSETLGKLEKVKEKTHKRLATVKSELDFREQEAKEEKDRYKSMLDAVSGELTSMKKTLEDVVKRERQLVDFREVVSRLLGLNVNTLALPDYEIIKRLERMVHNHQHHIVSCA